MKKLPEKLPEWPKTELYPNEAILWLNDKMLDIQNTLNQLIDYLQSTQSSSGGEQE